MKSIDINEIKDFSKVIDVREPNEYANMSILGTKNIPMMGIINNHQTFLNKDELYYIMCASGGRSSQVCHILTELGYNVVNVNGGINSYTK